MIQHCVPILPSALFANRQTDCLVLTDGDEVIRNGHGAPVDNRLASLTIGPRGPLLLQDINLIDEIAHFDRERIPERVVHAKGGGMGWFSTR
uniref:Catalase core domain-containing protein n=1 Tax=Timema douglasi TaxID=61478 RepID=A0A7R8VRB6_TIMDO|nr:unnamed protein product [Timema douglasi]